MAHRPRSQEHWRRLDGLFQAALDQPPEERTAWLEAQTAHEPGLRSEVEALLAAMDSHDGPLAPGGALRGALGDDLEATLPVGPWVAPGTRIGPYEVKGELGRGGMAVVYRAERVQGGFVQQVALKLIKRGTDTDEVLSRFTQERQILAALEHPAIARLYDGGSTADGQPYLAMELVEGQSIDQYAAARDLSLEQRLRLFFHVGRAVDHAHHHLVVHRDIKPSNVMVTADGHVKLLDFGIAKLIDPKPWPSAAPATRTHLRLLTPEYATPEQVRGLAVTTATDVYQLGLLLYELLTGKRPFELEGRPLTEIEQLICHEAPAAPSTALSKTSGSPPQPRDSRTSRTARQLARRLRGDLDNIVLKALAKEPERRYPTAGALIDDLERFLDGRPVKARPASLSYRTAKFARRHSWALSMAVTVLVVATALTWLYTSRLATERDRAAQAADKADGVSRFLSSVLGAADPYVSTAGPLTARRLLDEGLKRVDSELATQPEVQATTLVRLGEIYRNLSLMDAARSCFERSLALRLRLFGESSLEVAESRFFLASSMRARDVELARDLFEQVLAVRRERLGGAHPDVGRTLLKLASVARMTGQGAEARRLLEEARSILVAARGGDHPEVAEVLVALGQLHFQYQDEVQAINMVQQALTIRERAFGPESAKVAETLEILAGLYATAGDSAQALALVHRARLAADKTLDPSHPIFDDLRFEESKSLRGLGRPEAALKPLEDAITHSEAVYGKVHVRTLMFLEEKVRLLKWTHRNREALAISRDYVSRLESVFGRDSNHLANDLIEQADLLLRVGQRREARQQFDRGLNLITQRDDDVLPASTRAFHARLAAELNHPRAAELAAKASTSEEEPASPKR